ncbi:MAG: HEAT repeat domain-containing protein [Planctomycetes bacterium]|nr:HEAT repeat domain-containing protein [Planctomycetota bacterium]
MKTIASYLFLVAGCALTAPTVHANGAAPVKVIQRFDSQWVLKANEILAQERLAGRVLEDVAAELAGFGPNAIQAYFAILSGTVDGPYLEGAAFPAAGSLEPNDVLMAALARMRPADVAAHVAAAASGDVPFDVRIVAMRVLDEVGAEGGFAAWTQIVGEIDPELLPRAYVQGPCERALASVLARDNQAFRGLQERISKLDAKLIPLVLRGIGACRRAQGVPVLTALLGRLRDSDLVLLPSIAQLVESTTGDMSDEDLTWLRPFASDEDWRVRREAVIALGRIGDWRSHALLVTSLGDENRLVQQAARWALIRLAGVDYEEDASAWSDWFETEIAWYETNGSRLAREIDSAEPALAVESVREFAAHGLFRHDAARAIVRMCLRTDADIVRQGCLVLSDLRSPAAIPGLLDALQSEDASIREAARATLSAITGLQLAPDGPAWRRALVGA